MRTVLRHLSLLPSVLCLAATTVVAQAHERGPACLIEADRQVVGQGAVPEGGEGTPTLVSLVVPAAQTGTGTDEQAWYQLPVGYDPFGPELPLVVAYHGFGTSALGVSAQSTLDEECDARGWIYLSVTGLNDQIFGTPASQQNTTAAIQHMLDTFQVDADRIYMVGFSMGAGVVASYAARHRDPDGVMIAALGLVSGTHDWAQEHSLGTPALKAILESPQNFGGTPLQELFRYRQASSLHFQQGTYPPYPGILDAMTSMATNLHDVPTFITYDSGDTIVNVPSVNDALETLLVSRGATVTKQVVSGTVDPSDGVTPAPHSWAVLDEASLFTFLDGKVVERYPLELDVQIDGPGTVAWIETVSPQPNQFSFYHAVADPVGGEVEVTEVRNVDVMTTDVRPTGATQQGVRFVASDADFQGFDLRLYGFDDTPSYMLRTADDTLLEGTDSDPSLDALVAHVPAFGQLDAYVVHAPKWTATMVTTPNPVVNGNAATVAIDGPPGYDFCFFIFAVAEQLLTVKGAPLVASPLPPALLLSLPTDGFGDVAFLLPVPADPLLQGVRLPFQTVFFDQGEAIASVTNLWGFYID